MKKMQSFHNRIFSQSESVIPRERHLAGVTRLNRDEINAVAAFDPWYLWE
jgi:hypothetical protein